MICSFEVKNGGLIIYIIISLFFLNYIKVRIKCLERYIYKNNEKKRKYMRKLEILIYFWIMENRGGGNEL